VHTVTVGTKIVAGEIVAFIFKVQVHAKISFTFSPPKFHSLFHRQNFIHFSPPWYTVSMIRSSSSRRDVMPTVGTKIVAGEIVAFIFKVQVHECRKYAAPPGRPRRSAVTSELNIG